jgi:acetyl-CoA carboxylase biotin carboxyl carrier protein
MGNGKTGVVKTEDIERLLELFKQSDWDEMHLQVAGLDIFVSNDPNARPPAASDANEPSGEVPARSYRREPGAGAPARDVSSADRVPDGMVAVRAPNLGTFYRAPRPGAPPYVEIGRGVERETEICLIEVMKLFTAVPAGVAGVVREIRVDDGQMVESGQVLAVIEPTA